MGRPKLAPDVKQSVTFTAKIRRGERDALNEIVMALNVERRERGDMAEITATDWLRNHIHADAKARGIDVPMPGAPAKSRPAPPGAPAKSRPAPKARKAPRKLK